MSISELPSPSAQGTHPPLVASLAVVQGRATKSHVKLKLPAILGRGKQATILIKHKEVSRVHCEIREYQGALLVRDLDSMNGTFVRGDRVDLALLKPGDTLTVGPLTFRAVYIHRGKFPETPRDLDLIEEIPAPKREGDRPLPVAAPAPDVPPSSPATPVEIDDLLPDFEEL